MIVLIMMLLLVSSNANANETLALNLDKVFKLVSLRNPQLLMNDERLKMAVSQVAQARSSLLPQVSGVLNGSRQVRDMRSTGMSLPGTGPSLGPFNSYDARVCVTMDLFSPQTVKRLKAAALNKEEQVALMHQGKQDIYAFVANLYLQAKRSFQHLRTVNLVVDYAESQLAKAKVQFDQGVIDDVQLAHYQTQFQQAKLALKQALVNESEDRLNLLAALGYPDTTKVRYLKDRIYNAKQSDQDSPQVIVAKASLKTAQAQLAAAKAAFLPNVLGVADLGYAGKDFNNDSRVYAVGIQASLPIWEGGLQQAYVDEKRANEALMQIKSEDDIQQSRNEKIVTAMALNHAKALLVYHQYDFNRANKDFDTIAKKFDQGIVDEVEFKRALADQAVAKDAYQEAFAFYQMSQITMAHAHGTLGLMTSKN